MKNILFIIVAIFSLQQSTLAQSVISGSLIDSNTYLPVRLATVSLIRESDSVLISYTRTDYEGKYKVQSPQPGEYYLLYAHPTFVDYLDRISTNGQDINLGEKNILTRAKMLEEVIVRQRGQIFIKGDTLEYLTDSLKLDESANVEDLLKALPGMQVDKDGNITAQGEKVEKVLVDGEEFFGNDPTMVTRNLNANIVDKVQVYEKKSEEAEFTGIDDGEGQKTIDIKLKKDMNKGVFGKIALNGGLENIWDNVLLVNSFKGKRKLSLYGIASSNGEKGINWREMQKYGLNNNDRVQFDDGVITLSSGDIQYNGRGLPRNWSSGFTYSNLWNEKHRLKFTGGWRKMDLRTDDSSYTNNFMTGNEYTNIEKNDAYGVKQQYTSSLEYEWDIDSLTKVGANANITYGNSHKEQNQLFSNIQILDSELLSQNINKTADQDTSFVFNTSVFAKRKLNKPGRTISAYFNYNEDKQNFAQQKDQNIRYGLSPDHSLQKMDGVTNNKNIGGQIVYTEPLYKESWTLKLTEKYLQTTQSTDYLTQAHDIADTEYENIDSLSNNFDFIQNQFTTSFAVQYKDKKIRANIELGAGFSDFERKDYLRPENSQQFNRNNLFPSLRMRYNFSQFTQLRFSYRGYTVQPTLSQLQPNYDFSNPLNIVFGNPDLDQEYNQNINLSFWSYDAFKERSVYAGIRYSNILDNISSVSFFDPNLGRSVATYTNLNGNNSFSQWFGWNRKLDSSNFTLGFSLNSSYFAYPFETNGILGQSSTFSISPTASISYNIDKKFQCDIDLNPRYTSTKSEVRNLANNYWSLTPSFDLTYRPVRFIKIKTDLDYTYRQKTPPFTSDFHRLIWDASLSGFLDEDRRMELKFTAHDILNQNNGYERSAYSFSVSEDYFLTIRRYFMLGFIYNFAVGPMAAKQNPGETDTDSHW